MHRVETILMSLLLVLISVGPVMAAATTTTYRSGILILAFVGVCALLVVVQLLPALRALFGITKDAAKKNASHYSNTVSSRKR